MFYVIFSGISLSALLSYWEAKEWQWATGKVDYISQRPNLDACSVSYSYQADGQIFKGERLAHVGYGVTYGKNRYACILLAEQGIPEIGDVIKVKFNPSAPQESVFIDAFPVSCMWTIIYINIGFGILFWMLYRKER